MSNSRPFIRVPLSDFPMDVLKWMKINAKPKMLFKLMKCCKYFQDLPEFPFFVVKQFYTVNNWFFETLTGKFLTYEGEQEFEKINKNLWITDILAINGQANIFSSVFPKIAVCEVRKLSFSSQKLSFDEFKFLTCSGNVKYLDIKKTFINHKNGDPVYIDSILKCVPNVEIFKW
uniref:F-box domain-containing protein n=1 Tax=Panagrolaimus davidi TaxID=227884 RepID=A0A914QIY8_9BILA